MNELYENNINLQILKISIIVDFILIVLVIIYLIYLCYKIYIDYTDLRSHRFEKTKLTNSNLKTCITAWLIEVYYKQMSKKDFIDKLEVFVVIESRKEKHILKILEVFKVEYNAIHGNIVRLTSEQDTYLKDDCLSKTATQILLLTNYDSPAPAINQIHFENNVI